MIFDFVENVNVLNKDEKVKPALIDERPACHASDRRTGTQIWIPIKKSGNNNP
ncbi:MAG TPA: hypothetical protein VMW76_05870 [Bacteroidales bacterium]|nr:hypothetical protein [Bacteroidales bacterium]